MTLSIYLNSAPVQGQKEMSFFDGIFPHCLWMMITLLSQIKLWLLNYIILIIHSYQSGPGPVLPARIVLCAGCNHHFLKDKEVAKVQHSYFAGSSAGSHSRIVILVIWLSGLNPVRCKLNMKHSPSVMSCSDIIPKIYFNVIYRCLFRGSNSSLMRFIKMWRPNVSYIRL